MHLQCDGIDTHKLVALGSHDHMCVTDPGLQVKEW